MFAIRFGLLFTICAFLSAQDQSFSKDLLRVADLMTGSYSSAEQAAEDEAFFDIRLEMVRIWPNRKDAVWLYIEQAAASRLTQPYRQRIYRLTEIEDGRFESKVYEFPEALTFAGAYREPAKFDRLNPEALVERPGCSVFFKHNPTDDTYQGSTPGKDCLSSHRGATYATSIITLTSKTLVSWDQGWNEKDEQVWGAEKGGYIFKKLSE